MHNKKNPIIICLKLIIMIIIWSTILWQKSSITLTPLLIVILFLGGVLIIFIIISRIIPREIIKVKRLKTIIALFTFIALITEINFNLPSTSNFINIEEILKDQEYIIIIILIARTYFSIIIYICTKEYSSTRFHL